jgi:hypothetical protein
VTQQNQYPAPAPGYPADQQGYGYPQPGPQKTNTMAILGLVFAFVFSPLGVVFSAIGLKQVKERREGGRGLALAGLILSIAFILIGILFAVLALTVFSAAVEEAVQAQDAVSASDSPADAAAPEDTDGVIAACEVIVPAVVNLESDLATVQTPEDYAAVMTSLRTTLESAAAQTTDPTFIAHVQTLSSDFQQAVDAVNADQDPTFLEEALTADGTQIDNDCAAAGYVQ